MSNTEYFECNNCECLMEEKKNGNIECPHCKCSFNINDGSDFPNEDDNDYNDGFRRGLKKK